jgi:hypothetical protein
MSRMAVSVPLVCLLVLPALGDEPKPAAELLSSGVAKAKDQGKTVFVLFGSPT